MTAVDSPRVVDGGCGPMEGASVEIFSKGENNERNGQILEEFELDVDQESLALL